MSDFQKLWAGQTVSLLGNAITMFALPSLAVLFLHATPVQLGTIGALESLPFPILGMAVGVLADRYSRRMLMIAADCVRFIALATIPIAALYGVLGLPQVYIVALVTGVASAFFGITYQSYLPAVVTVEKLADANMKLEFSNSGSVMAGNAVAGVLVQWIGAAAAIGIDALSYVVSIVSLAFIGAREPEHSGPRLSIRQGLREISEGIALVMHSSDLRWILCATATTNLGVAVIDAVVLIYLYRILHLQPALIGTTLGLAQLGFIGALCSAKLRNRFGLRPTLIGALFLGSIGGAILLLAQNGWPYAALFLSSAIMATATPIYNVNQISYRQALVDVRMQGRLNATMRTFVLGTLPLGALAGGFLGGAIGIVNTIALGAVICAFAAVWLFALRERPHPTAPNPHLQQ